MSLRTAQTVRNSADAADAASALLRDLIDYAGLFPPASLAMTPAVANYDAYSRSKWNWILGRFIVPAARLGEFEEAFAGLPTPTPRIPQVGGYLSFSVPIRLPMSLAFANSIGELLTPSPAAGPSSSRLR